MSETENKSVNKLRSTVAENRDGEEATAPAEEQKQEKRAEVILGTAAEPEKFDVFNRDELFGVFDQLALPEFGKIVTAEETTIGNKTKSTLSNGSSTTAGSSLMGMSAVRGGSSRVASSGRSFRGEKSDFRQVNISAIQAGRIEEGRESLTSNYQLYCTLQEKVLTDPIRRNPMGKKDDDNPLKKEEPKKPAWGEDPDKTPICFQFWEMIDGWMKACKAELGVGTCPISEGNKDKFQDITDSIMPLLGRWMASGLWLAEIDPFLLIHDQFTKPGKEAPFTGEQVLEECFHGVRHGLFEMVWGSTCRRCTNSQMYESNIANIPLESTCGSCGMHNVNDQMTNLRIKFKLTTELFYIPIVAPLCCMTSELLGRCEGMTLLYPGGNHGAKYQYNMSLPKGDHVIMCPVTDTKIKLVVADDAPDAEEGKEPERLEVVLRASWIEGERHVVNVEHGNLLIKAVQDTATICMHIFIKDFYVQDQLTVTEAEIPPFTTGHHVLGHPSFSRYFPGQVLGNEQELKMGHTIICFTDLLDSTQQYSDLGDGSALRLVKDHFELLFGAISEENGRVVKTIGDAVMCTFQSVAACLRAVTRAMQSMLLYNETCDCPEHGHMHLKVGIHKGPALMVPLNGINDFFGQTVNIAARVQGMAEADEIVISAAALADLGAVEEVDEIIGQGVMTKNATTSAKLKGVKTPIELSSYTVNHPDDNISPGLLHAFSFRNIIPLEMEKILAGANGPKPGVKEEGVEDPEPTKQAEKEAPSAKAAKTSPAASGSVKKSPAPAPSKEPTPPAANAAKSNSTRNGPAPAKTAGNPQPKPSPPAGKSNSGASTSRKPSVGAVKDTNGTDRKPSIGGKKAPQKL